MLETQLACALEKTYDHLLLALRQLIFLQKAAMSEDRRKIKRRYLMYYSRVFDAHTQILLGHLVDLTPQGAMLISEKPITTDLNFRLKMELSSEIANKRFLEFESKSLWCRRDIDPSFYNTGFELINIADEDRAIIERIVNAYGFRDNEAKG